MAAILKQPFPAHSLPGAFRTAALIGFFVAVFLLVFQPFGLRGIPGGWYKTGIICGYGLVSLIGVSFSSLVLSQVFPGWFKPARWSVGKEIGITLFNFLLIGLLNTLYTFTVFGEAFSFKYLLFFEMITLAVGILPVSLLVLWRYNRLLHANLKLAGEMNAGLRPAPFLKVGQSPAKSGSVVAERRESGPKPALLTFSSENGTDQVSLSAKDFLFATAADNYVELHFLDGEITRKSLIRSSLTRLEDVVKEDPSLVRCHRAYLVNLAQVHNFSGNAQGLKLSLNHTAAVIPVSRKMVPGIKALLHS